MNLQLVLLGSSIWEISTIIVYLIPIAIVIAITRIVFGIPTILRHQKAQTKLLAKIAEKQGVNIDEIQSIEAEANYSPFAPTQNQ